MKKGSSILKHLDFFVLDIIVLELSYFLAIVWYAQRNGAFIRFTTLNRLTSLILLSCVMFSVVIDTP